MSSSPEIIFEPFRIKTVERIEFSTPEQRSRWIAEAGYNVFNLRADEVLIDLLTDSGTAAMSAEQWAALQCGDESYAGSKSFFDLEQAARATFGKEIIIPVHQGRAGEHLLFALLVNAGDIIPSNGHFDTTAANIEDCKGRALNLPCQEAADRFSAHPFKGNMDTSALERLLSEQSAAVPFVMLTVTNNTGGGQPVSMENIRAVAAICRRFEKRLVIDACRFAENACFIKLREAEFKEKTIPAIVHDMLSHADVLTFSAKKDGLANIGGLVCLDDPVLAENLKNRLIVTEGFATYGGLAGRDLAAIAQGLREVVDERYLRYRLRTIEWMVERLQAKNIPVVTPAGGHALYLDAQRFFPHLPAERFPGIALVVELYRRGGIRGVELGNVAFGTRDARGAHVFPPADLVRLAFPRRVYTEAHAAYVVDHLVRLFEERDSVGGYDFLHEAPVMRHFRSTFTPAQ